MFLEFVREVYNLDFEQEPDYSNLKELLKNILRDHGLVYTSSFDWSMNDHQQNQMNITDSHDPKRLVMPFEKFKLVHQNI